MRNRACLQLTLLGRSLAANTRNQDTVRARNADGGGVWQALGSAGLQYERLSQLGTVYACLQEELESRFAILFLEIRGCDSRPSVTT
jgi:hypothetical protein